MKLFNIVFNVGLGVAVLLLLLRNTTLMQGLLPVGIIHMFALVTVAWLSDKKLTFSLVEGLHKAGFLHTLMALAASLIVSANVLGAKEFKADQLQYVLLPMGAALIPHVLGVWGGQVLGSRYLELTPAIEETIFKKLSEDADTARATIKQLFSEREQALRQQIASLQLQKKLLDDLHATSTKTVQQALLQLGDFLNGIEQTTTHLKTALSSLVTTIQSVTSTASQARTSISECATHAQSCTQAIRTTIDVVKDVHTLHDAITTLLSEKLFRTTTT